MPVFVLVVYIGSTSSVSFRRNISIDLHHCPECHIRNYSLRHFHSQFHTNRGLCKPSCVSGMNTFGLSNGFHADI